MKYEGMLFFLQRRWWGPWGPSNSGLRRGACWWEKTNKRPKRKISRAVTGLAVGAIVFWGMLPQGATQGAARCPFEGRKIKNTCGGTTRCSHRSVGPGVGDHETAVFSLFVLSLPLVAISLRIKMKCPGYPWGNKLVLHVLPSVTFHNHRIPIKPGPNSVVMFSPKSWQSESVSNDGDFSERKVTYLEILMDLLRFAGWCCLNDLIRVNAHEPPSRLL